MKRTRSISTLLFLLLSLGIGSVSCDRSYTPKPAGYLRIDIPEKAYRVYDAQPFYSFEIPVYAEILESKRTGEAGWLNLVVPQINCTLHLSYKPVNDNLGSYISDCRTLAYKHTVKADGIEETPFINRGDRQFGMVYDLSGDVASAVQFFITDSTTHFLRGSLYFNCPPNRDSLRPVIEFMRKDIMHLIETTRWKY